MSLIFRDLSWLGGYNLSRETIVDRKTNKCCVWPHLLYAMFDLINYAGKYSPKHTAPAAICFKGRIVSRQFGRDTIVVSDEMSRGGGVLDRRSGMGRCGRDVQTLTSTHISITLVCLSYFRGQIKLEPHTHWSPTSIPVPFIWKSPRLSSQYTCPHWVPIFWLRSRWKSTE